MKLRWFKYAAVTAVVFGATIAGAAVHAHAALVLQLQEDSGTVVTVSVPVNSGPAMFTGTIGTGGSGGTDFTVVLSIGTSNSPGTPGSALTQESNILITNNTGSTHTLHINVSAQGFTSPNSPPPLVLMDTVSGTLVNGSVSGSLQGFADATNTLFGTGTPAPKLTFSASGLSKSFSVDGHAAGFSPDGNTYSLSLFADYTLGGGSSLTLTGGNVQAVPTPEPATVVMALSGLGLFGASRLRRSRRAD